MDKFKYQNIVSNAKVNIHLKKDLLLAFLAGGFIAIFEEFICDILVLNHIEVERSIFITNMIIIFIVILLTYFSLYKKLGQIFGAGLFFPLTGFANSTVSGAFSGKNKGLINGIGSKILSLSSSVICYGLLISFYFALIHYFLNLLGLKIW